MNAFHQQAIEEILRPMHQSQGVEYVEKVVQIVARNLQNGRVDLGDSTLDQQERVAKIQQYTLRVVNIYEEEVDRVEALQVTQDPLLWEELYEQLYQWAWYSIGKKWPTVSYEQRTQLVSEITPEAGLRISQSYFFYDTPFEAWMRMIVWHVTYEVMRRYMRDSQRTVQIATDEEYEPVVPLLIDQGEALLEIDSVPHLQQAIGNLSDRQRNVIISHYIEGLSLAEIAKDLEAEPNNVYQLHYQGLKNLRKQLVQLMHKKNRPLVIE